jgi:dihydroflavonol-4-reductase
MKTSRTILLTGASGQLGRKLLKRLLGAGFRVRAHYRSSDKAARWCLPEATPVFGDLLEPGWLAPAAKGCDYVIHCAARVSLRPAAIEPMRQINVIGTQAVVEACLKCGIKRLVHISSVAAIGASLNGNPIDETAPFNLSGYGIPYFETKNEAEKVALAGNSENLEVIVVNPSIMISAPDREISQKELAKIPRWLPFYFDFGVNIVDAADVVEGIILALEKGQPGRRYILAGENIGPERTFELAKRYLGVSRPLIKIPNWGVYMAGLLAELAYIGQPKKLRVNRAIARLTRLRFYYDSARARRELGWEATPLEDTIGRILAAIQRQLGKNT